MMTACDKRGDFSEPYAAEDSAFTQPNPGNKTGAPVKGMQASDQPGGSTSGGVTSGAPSTMAGGAGAVAPPDAHQSKAGGENESNAAGATAPGGASGTPSAGGQGAPKDPEPEEKQR